MRRAARKDVVHGPIVEGLKTHGIAVLDMPDPGDVLCYRDVDVCRVLQSLGCDPNRSIFTLGLADVSKLIKQCQMWMPIELKSSNRIRKQAKQLTPAQERRAKVAPIPLAMTLAEALALFGMTP